MTEPASKQYSSEFEKKLDAIYNAQTPDPDFALRLEMRLAEKSRRMQPQALTESHLPGGLFRHFRNRPAQAIALGAALLLVIIVAIAGPKAVLAQVQRLLGYDPSSGFVEVGKTRILPSPIEQSQGDVILRIDSVVANSSGTQIILTVSGLPQEKFGTDQIASPDEAKAYLLLPDNTRLVSNQAFSGIGKVLQAFLTFPALPEEVSQITLVLPRLPSLPAGFAPENWSVPLKLETAVSTGSSSTPGIPLAKSYSPAGASTSSNGVTISLLQVGQSAEETGLQVEYRWDDPAWTWLTGAQPVLEDEYGRQYATRQPALGNAFEIGNQGAKTTGGEETLRFDPFDSQAQTGILTFNKLTFDFIGGEHFTFNPGNDAQPGQTWDLSQTPGSTIDVAGLPVHILSATIGEPQAQGPDSQEIVYPINILVEALPTNDEEIGDLALSNVPDHRVSSSCEILPDHRFLLTIGLPGIPDRPLTLYFSNGSVSLTGSWEIEWPLQTAPGS